MTTTYAAFTSLSLNDVLSTDSELHYAINVDRAKQTMVSPQEHSMLFGFNATSTLCICCGRTVDTLDTDLHGMCVYCSNY